MSPLLCPHEVLPAVLHPNLPPRAGGAPSLEVPEPTDGTWAARPGGGTQPMAGLVLGGPTLPSDCSHSIIKTPNRPRERCVPYPYGINCAPVHVRRSSPLPARLLRQLPSCPRVPSSSAMRPGPPSRGRRGASGHEEEAAAAAAPDPAALLPSAGAGANFTGAARAPSARPGRTERNGTAALPVPSALPQRPAHLRSRRSSPCCGGSGRARPK